MLLLITSITIPGHNNLYYYIAKPTLALVDVNPNQTVNQNLTICIFYTILVMVDSIIALHRAEYTGRATLAERQQRLNMMLHKLSRLAEVHNIAVVVTNQVQSQPDDFSASRDGLRATGGNVMGHASTYRILLRKAGSTRIAIMIDSPYHAYRPN